MKNWIWLLPVLLLTGCGWLRGETKVLEIDVTASPQINPDGEGRPSPVVSRVYFLKRPNRFEAADFFSLLQEERKALGDTLIGMEELRLSPGKRTTFIRELTEDVGWIGVIAAFRDIDNALWRQLVEVPPQRTSRLTLRLDALMVTLDLVEPR